MRQARGFAARGSIRIKATYESTAPLRRSCTAEDVAEAVLWLIDGARAVTGELLLLDAGCIWAQPKPQFLASR